MSRSVARFSRRERVWVGLAFVAIAVAATPWIAPHAADAEPHGDERGAQHRHRRRATAPASGYEAPHASGYHAASVYGVYSLHFGDPVYSDREGGYAGIEMYGPTRSASGYDDPSGY
jgi:hypothetical protein